MKRLMKWQLVSIALLGFMVLGVAQTAVAQTSLTDDEAAGLIFMREEEKLARDVYLTLADAWERPIFRNIARSEQQHMNAVLTVLNQYGLTDPVGNNGIGVFTDPQLQQLYDELVAQGQESAAAAIDVGILIEKTDIADLQARLANTDNPELERLYGNLLRGSQNHLAAFEKTAVKQQPTPKPNPGPGRRGRGRW